MPVVGAFIDETIGRNGVPSLRVRVRTATVILRFHCSYADHQTVINLNDYLRQSQDQIITVEYLGEDTQC
jgi:hypothetical protein